MSVSAGIGMFVEMKTRVPMLLLIAAWPAAGGGQDSSDLESGRDRRPQLSMALHVLISGDWNSASLKDPTSLHGGGGVGSTLYVSGRQCDA